MGRTIYFCYTSGMKVLIDARMMGPEQRGIGRYVEELVRSMTMIPATHIDWWLIVRSPLVTISPNIHTVIEPTRWYTLREQWRVPLQILRVRPSLVHIPHFNVPILLSVGRLLRVMPPFVLTIHDLLLVTNPREQATMRSLLVWRIKYAFFRITLFFGLRAATRIIAVSDSTANEVRALLPKQRHHSIQVITEATTVLPLHDCERGQSAACRKKKPYVLTVGSTYPHKRLSLVFEALQTLWNSSKEIEWVHVGAHEALSKEFFDTIRNEEREVHPVATWIYPVGHQSNEELSAWYAHSLAFLYPSEHEGYGLPVGEALLCGARVITAPVPALNNIDIAAVQSRIVVIDPAKSIIDQLVEGIIQWLHKKPDLSQEFHPQQSWVRIAQETIRVYNTSIHH